ncbi:hypothetical protein QQ054_13080 [Oscillatoria amoena NRMC-F 0135]|jgi:hypothetical protein|nr:MAG: hypothetical protein F9K23_18240 [Bacteroidota bacterium]MDL5046954.1 hypothetical protein [Oscillatoria amoena NRMC-F 0135]
MDILLEYIFRFALVAVLLIEIIRYYKLLTGKKIRLQKKAAPAKNKICMELAFLSRVAIPVGTIIYSIDNTHNWDWPWILLSFLVILPNLFIGPFIKKKL